MSTVLVYKTNVDEKSEADAILDNIREQLPDVEPSFDLEDCDNVLRVESINGRIDGTQIEAIMKEAGFQIKTLL